MTIFGINAFHNGDVSNEFLRQNKVCTCCTKEENPSMHASFRRLGREDVVFIKTSTPQIGLTVKAVGIVTSGNTFKDGLGICVPVQWLWKGNMLIENIDDSCPFRGDMIYEELNAWVQRKIMELLPDKYNCFPQGMVIHP